MINKKGFSVIALVMVVAIVLVCVGAFFWRMNKIPSTQVNQNNTPAAVNSAENTSSSSLIINRWGVAFDKPTNMADLQYAILGSATDAVTFTTQQLMDLDKSTGGNYCTADQSPIGVLSRAASIDSPDRRSVPANVHIGNYYYFFTHPQATCSDNKQVQLLETQEAGSLQTSILNTLHSVTSLSSSVAKTYTLSQCGVQLVVNTAQLVRVESGDLYGQIIVGDPLPNSQLEIFCHARDINSPNPSYDVSKYLSIQSDGASPVDKSAYQVFDQNSLNLIQQMYSAKNGGYRRGSETIGFQTARWMYTFSFLNPQQNKDQNSFVISVNPTN